MYVDLARVRVRVRVRARARVMVRVRVRVRVRVLGSQGIEWGWRGRSTVQSLTVLEWSGRARRVIARGKRRALIDPSRHKTACEPR